MSNTLILKNSVMAFFPLAEQSFAVPITVVSFQKLFGNQPDGSLPPNTVINPGDEVSITFQGGTGSGDYYSFCIFWSVPTGFGLPPFLEPPQEFVISSETLKRCDIEEEDINSPFPTVVEFFEESFSVGTPKSDGCFNNAYQKSTTSQTSPSTC